MLLRPDIPVPALRADDPRVGELVQAAHDPVAVIVGFPSDVGVERNGGRPGARLGPTAIRRALYRLTPGSTGMHQVWRRTLDLGDIETTGDLQTDQELLADVLAPYLKAGIIAMVMGGGHETAFGHFLGYARVGRSVSAINIDAHADVRDLIDGNPHSGSPFRQAIEHPGTPLRQYAVFGLAPHSTATTHVEYLRSVDALRVWNHEATPERFDELLESTRGDLMLTVDLDAFHQSEAPGVSAPTADGLTSLVGYRAAFSAGLESRVKSLDISELNPNFDADDRTARLAAMIVWHFVEGLTLRTDLANFLKTTN